MTRCLLDFECWISFKLVITMFCYSAASNKLMVVYVSHMKIPFSEFATPFSVFTCPLASLSSSVVYPRLSISSSTFCLSIFPVDIV